jgi:hypothetical protein
VVLSPTEWPTRQATFRAAFQTSPGSLPRTPCRFRWIEPSVPASPFGGSAGGLAALVIAVIQLFRRKSLNGSPQLALWHADAPEISTASLVVDIAVADDLGDGVGVVIGEFEMNGAMCIETSPGTIVWPTYNPRPPLLNAPRR